MLDLNDFFHFVQVVDHGGFAAASRGLRVPKSTLSHRIQQLEAALGVRLINRTSRQFGMTDVGNAFYRHAVAMLWQADAAESVVRQRLSEPSGTVRLATSVTIAQFAMKDLLPEFINRYPKVNIVQHATDVRVDIVGENYDLAIRAHAGLLPDSTLVQRTLASVPWVLFAGSDYLDRRGVPGAPDDLAKHGSIFLEHGGAAPVWRLRHPKREEIVIPIQPRFASNDMVALKQAACAGLVVVALPDYVCRSEIRSGELKYVLPGWIADDATVSVILPFRHGLLPSVRALVDFLADEFPKAVNPRLVSQG